MPGDNYGNLSDGFHLEGKHRVWADYQWCLDNTQRDIYIHSFCSLSLSTGP